jgi:hypothetical protein
MNHHHGNNKILSAAKDMLLHDLCIVVSYARDSSWRVAAWKAKVPWDVNTETFRGFELLRLVSIANIKVSSFGTMLYIKHVIRILGVFAELRKATTCFVLSVCLSIRVEQLGCQ